MEQTVKKINMLQYHQERNKPA